VLDTSCGPKRRRQLASDLEALHAKWFKAFDSGDGATMDQIEVDKLVLVMPTGFIWTKTKAIAGEQPKRDPETERALSSVSVRRFRGYGHPHWHSNHQVRQRKLTRGDDGSVRKEFWQVEDRFSAMEPT
jgi:hypothetical protein